MPRSSFHLTGSDSAALGGDLAYQYGKNGTLAGIGLTSAQGVIGDANFGSQARWANPAAALEFADRSDVKLKGEA